MIGELRHTRRGGAGRAEAVMKFIPHTLAMGPDFQASAVFIGL
jgi:hypothetical protein